MQLKHSAPLPNPSCCFPPKKSVHNFYHTHSQGGKVQIFRASLQEATFPVIECRGGFFGEGVIV